MQNPITLPTQQSTLVRYVTTLSEFLAFIPLLASAQAVAFDFETTGLDPHTDTVLLASFAWRDSTQQVQCAVVNVAVIKDAFWQMLLPFWQSKHVLRIAHNARFDIQFVYHAYGYHTVDHTTRFYPVHCTLVTEQLLCAGLVDHAFSLEEVVARRFQVTLQKEIREQFIQRQGDVFLDDEVQYAATDAYYTLLLYELQRVLIQQQELDRVYALEMQLVSIVAAMEFNGISVDEQLLHAAIPVAKEREDKLYAEIQRVAILSGFSTQIVFDVKTFTAIRPGQFVELARFCGLPVKNLDRRDLVDIDAKEYDDIADVIPLHVEGSSFRNTLLRLFDAYKAVQKIRGTYYEGFLQRMHPVTKRIHPQFHQCGGTATGRFSSSNPNFQNLPNKGKMDALGLGSYDVRSMFVAQEGHVFIIADYEGIELAVLAALSGDQQLIEQILRGDIHTFVANALFADQITAHLGEPLTSANRKIGKHKQVRDEFKRVSYATCYGSTGYSIYRTCSPSLAVLGIHITLQTAEEWVYRWKHDLFPSTGAFFDRMARSVVERGFTTSAYGRKRFWDVHGIRSSERFLKAAMREGMNHPIQASSADMTKLAMVWLADALCDFPSATIVASIHDEIVVSCQEQDADQVSAVVRSCMERAGSFLFPDADPQLFRASPKVSYRYDK